jgi:hypothetical protein
MKYFIEGNFVESKEAMEWMKANEGVFVESTHYNKLKYVYKEGYFIRYVHCNIGKGWYRLPYKYETLPRSEFEESVRGWVDEKMWCPVQ